MLVSRTVNCISRYLEEAERLDQSGTLSHEDCLHLSESIEFLFRKFSSDLISYGDCNAEQQLLITDTLSSLADLSFLFMKTFLRRTTSGGDAWPTFTYISILKALSPVPVQPSWQQIAVDALSSMHAILSSAVASRYLSVAECCALLEACAYEIASDKLLVSYCKPTITTTIRTVVLLLHIIRTLIITQSGPWVNCCEGMGTGIA